MKKPNFEIRSGSGLDEIESTRAALIAEDVKTGKIRTRLYQNTKRIKPLTAESEKALQYIASAFPDEEAIGGLSLQKGEMIIFNNGFGIAELAGIMHGRKGHISNLTVGCREDSYSHKTV